jgi:glycosyltransferase involved in cell wall biosynthesis
VKLVVQLPALNEEKTIGDVIRAIPSAMDGVHEVRVVVVDDGSTDRTGALAREAGALVVRHEQPRGVGAAFRSGIQKSAELDADIIVTIDADGQFNPADIPTLIRPILDGEADFVTASRFVDPAMVPDMPAVKRWGNDFMARWISRLVKQRFHDVSCGFRAYSRNAYLRLILIGDFTYTHEVFLSLAFANIPIKEVPIRVRGVREHGASRVAGSVFHYGRRTALIILRTYRDYHPLRFFTYLAATAFVAGMGFFTFLMYIRITTERFTPHKWAAFVAAAFVGAALITFLVGVMAEMLDRARVTQEEALFRIRRMEGDLRKLAARLPDEDDGAKQPDPPLRNHS